ncbi:MAG: hypothetical protein ACRCT8_16740 [Lacipirellulaceae bacterium]
MAASLVVATLCGCGPANGKSAISGTVTFDGEPISTGFVTFTPEGAGSPDAGPIHDGKFSLKAVPGKHRVKVEASRPMGDIIPSMGTRLHEEYIPARYNSETTLSGEVKSGENNEFEFNLTSKKE